MTTTPMTSDATVLVLDDDQEFARTLQSILEAKGYPTRLAHDGHTALEIVKSEDVAVAIIDLKLEDVPGIEVLRRIRQHDSRTECLLLTGHASQESAIEAINLGGFGFLQKPCDLDQLLIMIRRAIEKRDASEALRESERHTRAILHSSLDAVVTLDEMGHVIDWNPQAEKTLGWTRREALGRELFELVFPSGDESRRRAWGAPAEVALLGRPAEARLRRKDGREIEVEWVVTTVELSERRTLTFFIQDVTRRKRLEEQFLHAQRTEAVSLLAGGVLHDFSNVLTAIMGQAALLREDAQLGPRNRRTAGDILDAAQRSAALARQLLTYSRPQVRQGERLDLNGVVDKMSRLLKRILTENIDLRKRLDPELHAVELDPSEAEQVILNLVLNARAAMPGGGVLVLETRNVKTANGDAVELCIRDHGLGMDSTTLIRAFEPFFTTRELGQGAGLGLTTVKKIVEDSGGTIDLESTPGKGTRCRALFPACDAPTSPDQAGEVALSGTETVLLVEDESLVRSTLVRVLKAYGYQVLDAGSAADALRLSGTHSGDIDLLITDVIMPQMGGSELARRMIDERPATRVLYISGYSEHSSVRSGLGEDVELLPKPFAARDLLIKARKILDG